MFVYPMVWGISNSPFTAVDYRLGVVPYINNHEGKDIGIYGALVGPPNSTDNLGYS